MLEPGNFNFICTVQMNYSYTYRIYNFLSEIYYTNINKQNLERGSARWPKEAMLSSWSLSLSCLKYNEKKPTFIFVNFNGHITSIIYNKYYRHIKFCKQNTAMLIVLRENIFTQYDQHCSILLAEFNMSSLLFLLIRSLQILRSSAYSFAVLCSPLWLIFVVNIILTEAQLNLGAHSRAHAQLTKGIL